MATVESVLLYGAETWTLIAQQEKTLDGVYTRMPTNGTKRHVGGPYLKRGSLRLPATTHVEAAREEDGTGRTLRPPPGHWRPQPLIMCSPTTHHVGAEAWQQSEGWQESHLCGHPQARRVRYNDGWHHNQGPEDPDDG